MKLLLYIISRILAVICLPIGMIYAMLKPNRGGYFFKLAISIDQLGNVGMSRLFNDILIKPNRYQFGDEDETISSVLGRNQLDNTLKPLGKALVWVLDKLEKDHSINSIE